MAQVVQLAHLERQALLGRPVRRAQRRPHGPEKLGRLALLERMDQAQLLSMPLVGAVILGLMVPQIQQLPAVQVALVELVDQVELEERGEPEETAEA